MNSGLRARTLVGLVALVGACGATASACSPATAETDDSAEGGVANVTATSTPLPGSGASTITEGGAKVEPTAPDGGDNGKPASDASADARPDTSTALLPFGAKCTLSAQCATGLCLPFDKGLFCTKPCTKDSECPSDDCGSGPRVCNVD